MRLLVAAMMLAAGCGSPVTEATMDSMVDDGPAQVRVDCGKSVHFKVHAATEVGAVTIRLSDSSGVVFEEQFLGPASTGYDSFPEGRAGVWTADAIPSASYEGT